MRPRTIGTFVAGFDPKVALPDSQRIKIAGPRGSFRDGEVVTFWVAQDYTIYAPRMVAHSLEIAA
ncbi:hypothetical protein [Mesorhizobium sp.]|uniref:hypothetical protein n=1 Tax=Mesorhizobium sp. TaxID=1871066 RepID=UPI0012090747|nr:hypothetical protein [Mesorhizobium sp.]TIQ42538.1 MAG: hypothetical protein E5X47_31810 [Mesorhizobium sp.]TIQ54849.1 MAG: hypothetical protein E5X46_25575 [Mesorhizobium sp.]